MIIKESLESEKALLAFLNAKNQIDIEKKGRLLNPEKTFKVHQKFPFETTAFCLAQITAALGSPIHMQYVLNRIALKESLLHSLYRLSIRNLNDPVFDFLSKHYNLKESLQKILTHTPASEPYTVENILIDLINNSAASNNIQVLNELLSFDSLGYLALGVLGAQAPKQTPLHYAAITNSVAAFRRLLEYPIVREQFPENYQKFYQSLEQPISSELINELNELKPEIPFPLKIDLPSSCSFWKYEKVELSPCSLYVSPVPLGEDDSPSIF